MNMSKSDYVRLFATNPVALESAILAIFDRQTATEKEARNTFELNHKGFSAAHVRKLSRNAIWIRRNRARIEGRVNQAFLDARYREVAAKIMPSYWRQLNEVLAARKAVLTSK